MKRYLIAVVLGTLIAPPLGATIYGSLMGNPFIIIYPIVLLVAYMVEGIPFIVFGLAGSLLHRSTIRKRGSVTPLSSAGYGLIMGTMCGLIPMLIGFNAGYWTLNRSISSFIASGAITGIVCALLGNRYLNSRDAVNKGLARTGDPRTVRKSAQT